MIAEFVGDLLTTAASALSWQDRAACRGTDTEAFFPERGKQPGPAKRICLGCPVRGECLEDALTYVPAPHGIWGGTTQKEREPLRAARSREQLDAYLSEEDVA